MKNNLIVISIRPLVTIAFCILVFFLHPVMAQAQNDNDSTGVLPNQMIDSRSNSMGGATIADVYGRPSIGINAALFGLFKKPQFIQFNTGHNWDTNFMQHSLSLPTLIKGPHHFTMRLGLIHRGFENLPFTSSTSLPEPDLSLVRAELAYAIVLSNYFSLGTLQSVSYTTANEGTKSWSYFADVGLIYAPDGPVSYGMVFRGLGHETTYEVIESGQTELDKQLATKVLEIGLTLRYPIQERTYLSISFANEKRFGEDGLRYKGGIEIVPFSFIEIRGGVIANFDQSLFIPRIGLGVNANMFQLDYTIAPKNSIGEQFHQIGLTFQF